MSRSPTINRRRLAVAGALLAALAVAVVVALTSASGPGSTGAPRRATTTSSLPSAVRATGPDTCAFLSVDDIRRATGVPDAGLRQVLGPNGGPGCEWELGNPRSLLQLELGPDATPPAQGEVVPGPWTTGRWVAATRTLYVQGERLSLLVRITDPKPARAKEISIQVAVLASIRA